MPLSAISSRGLPSKMVERNRHVPLPHGVDSTVFLAIRLLTIRSTPSMVAEMVSGWSLDTPRHCNSICFSRARRLKAQDRVLDDLVQSDDHPLFPRPISLLPAARSSKSSISVCENRHDVRHASSISRC